MRRAGIALGIILIGLGIFGVASSESPRENPSPVRINRPGDAFTDQEFSVLRTLVRQLNRSDNFIYEGIRGLELKVDTVRTEVWSRAGDTIMVSGEAMTQGNQTNDTIALGVSFASTDSYEVVINWNEKPAADTLWVVKSGGSPGNHYSVDSFLVKFGFDPVPHKYSWIAVGN